MNCITYSNGDRSKAFSFSVNGRDMNLYIHTYSSWKWTEKWQQFNYISNSVFCDTILASAYRKGDIECIHLKLWGTERKGVEEKIIENCTLTIWYFSKYRKGFSLHVTEIFFVYENMWWMILKMEKWKYLIRYPNTKPNHHLDFNVYYFEASCKLIYETIKQAKRKNSPVEVYTVLILWHTSLSDQLKTRGNINFLQNKFYWDCCISEYSG